MSGPLGLPDNPEPFTGTQFVGYFNMSSFRFIKGAIQMTLVIPIEWRQEAWELSKLGDQMIPLTFDVGVYELYSDQLEEDESHLRLVQRHG